MNSKALFLAKIICMSQELKQEVLDKMKKILSKSFKDITEKQIDSMVEFIYKSSVVLVNEYIKKNQK